MRLTIDLPDEAATAQLGGALGALLRRGDAVALSGPLGAGKTALARAAIAVMTGEAEAQSPTFGLVHVYEGAAAPVWHFDLYRLDRPEDVHELGLEEALDEGVALIEWAERIDALLPEDALIVRLDHAGAGRRATIEAGGAWPRRLAALVRDNRQ